MQHNTNYLHSSFLKNGQHDENRVHWSGQIQPAICKKNNNNNKLTVIAKNSHPSLQS